MFLQKQLVKIQIAALNKLPVNCKYFMLVLKKKKAQSCPRVNLGTFSCINFQNSGMDDRQFVDVATSPRRRLFTSSFFNVSGVNQKMANYV